jgi:hypothetical protein
MVKEQYTTTDIIDKLEIPMQRLRMWLLNGYFTPSIPSAGQGQKAFFSHRDLYAIALFVQLLDQGYKRELASSFVKKYQASYQGKETSPSFYSNHLLFVTKKTGNATEVEMFSVAGVSNLQLKYEDTRISLVDDEQMETLLVECLWTNAMVVNFGLLKGLVDAAMSS